MIFYYLYHGGLRLNYKSERLIYREFKNNDFHLFYSIFSNEQIMKYALIDRFYCKEDSMPYFKRILQNNTINKNRTNFEYAVFLSSNNSFIGFVDIEIEKRNPFGGCCEIGYFILPSYWSNGYATEIAKTLIEICFEQLNVHRVAGRCNSNNLQSIRVLKKSGMVKEGEFRKIRFKDGRWDHEQHYSILFEEWILM